MVNRKEVDKPKFYTSNIVWEQTRVIGLKNCPTYPKPDDVFTIELRTANGARVEIEGKIVREEKDYIQKTYRVCHDGMIR